MLWPLRQSTASQEIPLGTFVDSTDGNTAEVGLTIANTDIKLQKNGATTQANKNSGGATHIAAGDYYAVLDATDTDTLGPMRVKVHVAGALPVWQDCAVYPPVVYDALFLGSDRLQVHTDEMTAGLIVAATFGAGAIDNNAIATDAIGSAEVAATAVTKIQTGISALTEAGVRTAVGMSAANLDTQLTSINAKTTNIPASPAATSDIPSAGTIVAAIKADAEWKTLLASAEGDWTFTPPASYPGTGILTLKDKAGAVTYATFTLSFNASQVITSRASA